VAKAIDYLHRKPLQTLGAKLLIDASAKSCDEVGDGTTTCTVLAHKILEEGLKTVTLDPSSALAVRKGIKLAVSSIVSQLKSEATQISSSDEVYSLALQSSNGDHHIATAIRDIYTKVGLNGAISVEDGPGVRETTVEHISGLKIESGFLSPYFADDREKIHFENENIYVALVSGPINTESELVKLLEFAKKTQRPLLIIAEEFSSQALTAMVINKL